MAKIVVYNLGNVMIPAYFQKIVSGYSFEELKIQLKSWSALQNLGVKIRQTLETDGCVLIKNLFNIYLDRNQQEALFAAFCFVGNIEPKENLNYSPTFSEHNLAVSLHTDSQYLSQPENFIAFWVEKVARHNEGKTSLLDFRFFQKEMETNQEGKSGF